MYCEIYDIFMIRNQLPEVDEVIILEIYKVTNRIC